MHNKVNSRRKDMKTSLIKKSSIWTLCLLTSGVFSLASTAVADGVTSTALMVIDQPVDTAKNITVTSNETVVSPSAVATNETSTDVSDKEIESCSSMGDKLKCMIDKTNMPMLQIFLNILSDHHGKKIVLTTAHFEEILTKMRELKFGKDDIEALKIDASKCIEKALPVLELIAEYGQFNLTKESIQFVCEELSSAAQAYNMLSTIGSMVSEKPAMTALVAAVAAVYVGNRMYGRLEQGPRWAGVLAVVGLAAYNILPILTGN